MLHPTTADSVDDFDFSLTLDDTKSSSSLVDCIDELIILEASVQTLLNLLDTLPSVF